MDKIDLSSVTNRIISIYPEEDTTCDIELNQSLLDSAPGQMFRSTITDDGITRASIQGANDNKGFMSLLFAALDIGSRDADGNPVCQ